MLPSVPATSLWTGGGWVAERQAEVGHLQPESVSTDTVPWGYADKPGDCELWESMVAAPRL